MARRVLSIQSHVVSGYVGNKSATFPLQVLGFEVDAINSVQFSNHTGYSHFKGQVLNSDQLDELMNGLRLNNLLPQYSHLLTGYVGDASFLRKVADVVKELKQINPDLIYVCDPVMGDNGKLYVPDNLLPIYKNEILPVANIVTPNQFEAELLTGQMIKTEDDALKAIEILHSCGPETVIVTSSDLGRADMLLGLASSSIGRPMQVRLEIPQLPASFTGTGDLFAACFLAWMSKSKGDLVVASEKTVATLQDVLKRTYRDAQERAGHGNKPTAAEMELKIIQSRCDIENPKTPFKAILLDADGARIVRRTTNATLDSQENEHNFK